MRITALRATPVAVPYRTDEVWAFGRRSGLVSVIVEVDTDEGLTGLGEAAAYPSADVVLGVLRSLEPLVIGSDPLRIEQLIQRIDVVGTWHHIGSSSPAIAAVETACWDLLGKSCGRPIVDFFGGRFRDEVEFFHYVAASDPSDVRAEARRAAKSGARLCYLKVGADSLKPTSNASPPSATAQALRWASEWTQTRRGPQERRYRRSGRWRSTAWKWSSNRCPAGTSRKWPTSAAA